MQAGDSNRPALRASLCAVEHGLFHATYHSERLEAIRRMLPAYQVGTSATDAKHRIEESAARLGYEAIIWEDDVVVSHAGADHNGAPPG